MPRAFSCSGCILWLRLIISHLASVGRGENVEDAFLETAKQIYQNIQDGSLDLNAAESGVQQKSPSSVPLSEKAPPKSGGCC